MAVLRDVGEFIVLLKSYFMELVLFPLCISNINHQVRGNSRFI